MKYHKNKFKSKNQNLPVRVILIREKKQIEAIYSFLSCSIKKGILTCIGKVKPTEYSREYTVKIQYDAISSPKVFVDDPIIEYNDDIHMFPKDNTLCLYHPETDNFHWNTKKHNIHNTIIPWALEWFVYYELYLISGKWEHPYKPHKISK